MPNLVLDLRYLKCALAAASLGSFRRAAVALELPQSTISRRVKHLEHRLGFPLFTRGSLGAKVTEAGAEFLRNAVRGAEHFDRAIRLAAAVQRGERGLLRIGLQASLSRGLLQAILRQFKRDQPDVQVSIREGASPEIVHALSLGDLDIIFVTGQPQISGCTVQPLWMESILVVLHGGHELAGKDAISWKELRGETFLFSGNGSESEMKDHLMGSLLQSGFYPRMHFHDVSRESLFDLVAMEFGIALATSSSQRHDRDDVVFRPILGEADAVSSSAAWSEENGNPVLRKLLRLVRSMTAIRSPTVLRGISQTSQILLPGAICAKLACLAEPVQILDQLL